MTPQNSAPGERYEPTCPVVEIVPGPDTGWFSFARKRIAVSSELRDEVLTDFTSRLNARRSIPGAIGRDIARQYELPGLAVVSCIGLRAGAHKLIVPPPLRTTFEPFELSERDPRLLAICAQVLGHPVSAPLLPSTFLLRLWWVACLLGIVLFAIHGNPFAALMALVVFVWAIKYLRPFAKTWCVTPTGVEVEGVPYAPSDTILVIEAGAGWDATLYRGAGCHTRLVSERECTALLAVWQSALTAKGTAQRL